MCRRRLKKSASNPISSSEDVSGFKFGFPGLLASKLLTSVPVCWSTFVTFCEPGENCWKASVGRGCTPFAPYAPRRRNELSQLNCGKKDSSEASHDALTFGYVMCWNL